MSGHDQIERVGVAPTPEFPIPDPGLEEHNPRWSDVDPAAGRRAYAQVVGMLAAVPILAITFVVIYFAVPRDMYVKLGPLHANAQHVGLGLTGGLGVLLIGLACIHWAKQIMGDEESIDYRHPARSSDADRAAVAAEFRKGVEQSGLSRRGLIGASLAGALGIVAVPAVVLLADMGVWPTKGKRAVTIETTIWAEGVRIVNDVDFKPIKAADMEIGQLVNGEPESLKEFEGSLQATERAKAAIIVVRMDPQSIKIPDSRKDWQVSGILCYSKICTHVGCPISLWEQQTHHLLCPCHQSTFDLGESGIVVFGPAARSLPQLPITVDKDGYLVARQGFTVPVGPSYFERDSRHDFQKGDN